MFELSQLRCFVAVADELHFGRAAHRLGMTQPPLSRQIRLLEHAVGAELFERSSRAVKLTQAGMSFLPNARRILRLVENAEISVRDVATGRSGVLHCSFTAAAAYNFLPSVLLRFKARVPKATVILKEMVTHRQLEALAAGEVDVALLRPPVDNVENDAICVLREELMVAVPHGHPLTRRTEIRWADLNDIPLIMYDTLDARYFNDLVVSHLAAHNVSPQVDHRLGQIHSILSMVRAGVGGGIVPASSRLLEVTNVDYLPFESNAPIVELMLVSQRGNRNPLVPVFSRIATEAAAVAPH